jgi:Spy/CpxP family protein refolding chaperone
MLRPLALFSALAAAASVTLTAAVAQTAPPFTPSLGDLMTILVQPRHAKLALGGQARNWDYAAFAVHELEESFERIEKLMPRYRDQSMSDLLKIVQEPIEAVEAAIKAKDAGRFDAALARLTQACNDCHRTTDHAMVVIQVPRTSAFPNQSFAPQRP